MRAVQYDKFGGSDLLTINEVPVPSPRPGQVLVRVQAFSVNRIDVIVREGEMRLFTGKRFPKGTGVDALGEVVSVGTGVIGLQSWRYCVGGSTAPFLWHPPAQQPNTCYSVRTGFTMRRASRTRLMRRHCRS